MLLHPANSDSLLANSGGTRRTKRHRLVMTVLVVCVGSSAQFGFATGSLNNLEPVIHNARLTPSEPPVTLLQWSLIVGGFGIGGLLGALGVHGASERLGHRRVLLYNNAFVLTASALLVHGTSWWMLAAGRVLIGIAASVATTAAPLYLAELSPRASRAAVGTAHQLGITGGLLLAHALTTTPFSAYFAEGAPQQWRRLFLVPLIGAALELLLLPRCPESPSWLYRTQGSSAALSTLCKLRGVDSTAAHIERLRMERAASDDEQAGGNSGGGGGNGVGGGNGGGGGVLWDAPARLTLAELFCSRALRTRLVVAVVLQLSMQLSGIDAIFYYGTLTLRATAGVAPPQLQLATTALAALNVVLTLLAVDVMDRAGRRALLLRAWAGMAVGYVVLTLALFAARYGDGGDPGDGGDGGDLGTHGAALARVVALCAMAAILVAFALGPGCVAWFVVAELFPPHARAAAMSLGVTINWLANVTVALGFPVLHRALGPAAFAPFAASAAAFGLFTLRYVPETARRSHDGIANDFSRVDFWMRGVHRESC